MDKTIRRYTDFGEMKADEYRYWQDRPINERLAAVSELTQEQYALKGGAPDVPRLQRTLVRYERVKFQRKQDHERPAPRISGSTSSPLQHPKPK